MIVSNSDQKEKINELKTELIKLGKYDETALPDDVLLRYLRARRFDVSKALKMLLESIQWRIDFKVDEIVKSFAFPEGKEVKKIYPRFYHKTDLKGRPLYIEQLGNADTKTLFKLSTPERLLQVYVRDMEKVLNYRFKACSKKFGKHIDQGCTILDLKGVPLMQFNECRKILQQVLGIAQNHYPETMGKLFIINAPTLFKGVWTLVKPLLDENTVAKISLLSSNYEAAVVEEIGRDNLPSIYGGNCKCPGGCEKSDVGPWNDGTVSGYPNEFWENMEDRDK
jgi:hypothetical protein